MQKNNFQFSISNFQLITVLLLLISSCTFSGKQNNTQAVDSVAVVDSLFVPTGNEQLDSLLQLAAAAKPDTNLAKLYYQIGDIYSNIDFDKSEEYFISLKNLSEQLDWNPGRYMFSIHYPRMLLRYGENDSALVVLNQGLELAKKLNDEEWMADVTVKIGLSYMNIEWYETALQYFMEVLPFTERMNNPEKLAYIYSTIGASYRNLNEIKKALEYGKKAYTLQNDDLYLLYQLGITYSSALQFEQANKYFEEALHICSLQNNIYLKGAIYYNLGSNALRVYDLKKAEKYLHQSWKITQEFNLDIIDISILLCKLEQLKGNFAKAEKIILEALQDVIELDLPNKQGLCYTILSELSMAQHNFRQYTQYLGKKDSIENVIALESTLRAAAEMEAKYETAKKELEIENQKQIIKSQNLQRGLLIGGVCISVVFLILLWYMLRLRTRRNRALSEMNATKDKFFSIISHDLKNPALAQQNALQVLLENAEFWDANTLKTYCQKLLKSADGQVELLYNLLNWAQIQTGRMPFQPVLFDLVTELRRTTLPLISDMATRKGVELITEMPENALITGDVNILSTVVRNLLDNAVKFTHTGGSITLKISQCKGVACNTLTTTRISISDTGTGMTEEQMQNLLRSHHQTSKQGTAGESGTGIGLVVCKELLEKHGSTLHIESKLNKGSCFRFEIK